jgi:hypothetical protein
MRQLAKWKVRAADGGIDVIAADKAYVDDFGNLRFYNNGDNHTQAQYAPKFWASYKLDDSKN